MPIPTSGDAISSLGEVPVTRSARKWRVRRAALQPLRPRRSGRTGGGSLYRGTADAPDVHSYLSADRHGFRFQGLYMSRSGSMSGAGIVADERAPYVPEPGAPGTVPAVRPEDRLASGTAGAPIPRLHPIDPLLLDGIRRLRRVEASLALAEGRELARLRKVHEHLGASFSEVVSERLWMQTRTAQERIVLAELVSRSPECEEAFLSGTLSLSKIMALKPVIECALKKRAAGAEASGEGSQDRTGLSAWLLESNDLSVRAIRKRVRAAHDSGALSNGDPRTRSAVPATRPWDPDEEGRYITIQGPAEFVLAWERTAEYARRVLGRKAPRHACLEAILMEAAPECASEPAGTSETTEDRQMSARPDDPVDRSTGVSADRQMSAHGASAGDRQMSAPGSTAGDRQMSAPGSTAGDRQMSAPGSTAGDRQMSAHPAAPGPRQYSVPPGRSEPPVMSLQFAEKDLDLLEHTLADAQSVIDAGSVEKDPSSDAEEVLVRLRTIHELTRPLEVLRARLVRDLRDTWALDRLGFESFEDFAERELGLCERAARDLRYKARLFDDRPALEAAYRENRIGITTASLIDKVACTRTIPQYLRRARKVLPSQLARELELRDRLDHIDPGLAALWTPQPSTSILEKALFDRLDRLGRSRKQVKRFLRHRGLMPLQTRKPPEPQKVSDDPAETPWRMRRLEALTEYLILTLCEEGAGIRHERPDGREAGAGGGADRQMSACVVSVRPDPAQEQKQAAVLAMLKKMSARMVDGGSSRRDPIILDDEPAVRVERALYRPRPEGEDRQMSAPGGGAGGADLAAGDRQMSACGDPEGKLDRQMSARLRPARLRSMRVSFWAPNEVADHLESAQRFVQEACVLPGPSGRIPILPDWGRLLLLMEAALDVWQQQDPETIPVNQKLLERDDCGCVKPGCPCKETLEGHHFKYRSRRGSNSSYNRGMVCYPDHRRIHKGWIRVKGQAPDGLIWQFGKSLVLRGARIIWNGPGAEQFFDEQ